MKMKLNLSGINIKNIALFAGFLLILNLIYPASFPTKFSLKIGDIAPKDIIAPHTFYIKKNKEELQEEKESIRKSIFFVLRRDRKQAQVVKKEAENFFEHLEKMRWEKEAFNKKRAKLIELESSLGKKEIGFLLIKNYRPLKDSLLKILDEVSKQGVITEKSKIDGAVVVILGEEKPRSIGEFLDSNELSRIFKSRATQMFPRNNDAISTFVALANSFVKPNLVADLPKTLKRREQAIMRINPTKGTVSKGEMIVRAHDIVTPEVIEKLQSLPKEAGISGMSTFIGRNIIYLIALLVLYLSLYFFHPPLLNDFWKLFLLMLLMFIVMGVSSLIILSKFSLYLIPIAIFGVLASLLLGIQAGVAGIIVLTILISIYSGGGFEMLILCLFSGVVSVFASTNVKKPSDFYKPALYTGGAYVLTALGMELIKLSSGLSLLKSLGYAAIGGVGSSFVAFGLLSFFERGFKITTPITLLEYTNPDHPILMDLSRYAPGTYHHSMTVAALAEQAARVVGANPLLARVGAYYHDIGKLKKPDYFIENQQDVNPHTKLNPELNARIIISHVREGIELARREKLPGEVIDIIKEHHGTTLVESFYNKAKLANKEVNELDFRYPGPLPHTKESAIVMLADSIEATARSLTNPTPSRIKGVIEDTLERKLEDGQLSKVNLSLVELKKIEQSFLPVLTGLFHQRIEYEKSADKKSEKESNNKKDFT